jgi:hypothetical protein
MPRSFNCLQASAWPRRNTNAPVNAANTIMLAASSTNRPMKEALRSPHALSTGIPI